VIAPGASSARVIARPARAVVYERDEQRYLTTDAVEKDGVDLRAVVDAIIAELRAITSRDALEPHGLEGFRLEDATSVLAICRDEADRVEVRRWLFRVLGRSAPVRVEIGSAERVRIGATFFKRHDPQDRRRTRYARLDDGRVRIEAFELHVTEHCNLRCRHCCNMSPYVDARFLAPSEVEAQCRAMAKHAKADVFKIMGGEPLLHPQITEVLGVIASTGISDTIRLFTNGLLLAKMPDDFWRALDHLTVSSYASAPVKPAHLALIEDKARAFDVVLNVKKVDRFSQVLSAERTRDEAAIKETYDACWLRHRCLVVRGGRFYKCTRAAYYQDFQTRLELAEPDPNAAETMLGDGLAIDAPDFGERLLAYMNADEPLGACRYCLGSSGPLSQHTQLTKLEVRRGRL
jgi:organic radical activating enzyme